MDEDDATGPARWPRSVFGVGQEPDSRFSFANQRTLLAWIRTALALVLAAAVVDAAPLDISAPLRATMSILLAVLGMVAALQGWRAWAASERAMRLGQPLPGGGRVTGIVVLGVFASAGLLVVFVVIEGLSR